MATKRTSKKDAETTAEEATEVEVPVETYNEPALPPIETLSDERLALMLKVLRAENRRRMKEREANKPKMGDKVKILRGNTKYVGKVGTAVVVRRTRCFVAVPDIESPAYLLVSDVEKVTEE